MIITIASLVGLGFLIGSTGLTTSRFNFVPNVATYTLMFLTGVNYPVDALPKWMQAVARLLPMTHGLEGFRAAMQGAGGSLVWRPFMYEVGIGLAYLAIGWSVFERRVSATRQGVSDFV
jgi:ABC-2 type transport system permease protein